METPRKYKTRNKDPSPEAAAFQAFRVVEDIALADMLAEAMRARQDERMQEIGKRIKR